MTGPTSESIKVIARQMGADLVGIASAETLNENPPDPAWPQVPRRFWRECRSVIVIAKRVPWGIYHTEEGINRLGAPQLVHVKLDQISLDLAYHLEEWSCYATPFYKDAVDSELKKGSYGALSLRHLAVEAGLGTLGLNMMLLTPQYGPRVYLTCVLTDAPLEPDSRIRERLCAWPTCDRCLLVCPADAVRHWGIDKRRCRDYAQRFGYAALLNHLRGIMGTEDWEQKLALMGSSISLNLFQGLQSGVGTFAGCLRCVAVCPVGKDYNPHVSGKQTSVLEATPDKQAKLEEMRLAERSGEKARGEIMSERWIGAPG